MSAPDLTKITRCISVRQPWAWLIVQGHKSFENRSWHFAAPGPVFIHASKGMTKAEYLDGYFALQKLVPEVTLPYFDELPRGGIVGWAVLGKLEPDKTADPWSFGSGYPIISAGPLVFTPCKGRLGIFRPPINVNLTLP